MYLWGNDLGTFIFLLVTIFMDRMPQVEPDMVPGVTFLST